MGNPALTLRQATGKEQEAFMLSLRPWYFLFASFASTLVFSKVAQARSTEKPTTSGTRPAMRTRVPRWTGLNASVDAKGAKEDRKERKGKEALSKGW